MVFSCNWGGAKLRPFPATQGLGAGPVVIPTAGPVVETTPQPDEPVTYCIYIVTTLEGVTEPRVYTLEPTVDTMCLRSDVIQDGIATVTAEDNSRYLVCRVKNQITVSTLPPEEEPTRAQVRRPAVRAYRRIPRAPIARPAARIWERASAPRRISNA
ncbi:hypothetical protein CEP53_004306 [Fusarium sp. AF-6]|nr:hypothetical protein CEP53_004306 [Fusarium sp. AF-6]